MKHQRVNRCSSSMPWIRVQELSQQYWPLLLVTVMHTFLHLLLLSNLWYSLNLGFKRVVLHMHQFAFFSLSSLLSFGISLQLQTLVQVLHRDIARVSSQGFVIQITGFTRYKVPRTNAGVGILLRFKILPVYPREPQIALFLTQIVSFLPLVR